MRILIIDDEENIRRTLSALLESMDHKTVGVGDGSSALQQLEKHQFDAAFLDLKLREESGLDLLPKLLRNTPQLDVVVFTAFASFESAVEAMRRGASDYIAKPFTPDQIEQVLGKISKTRHLRGRLSDLEARVSAVIPEVDLTTNDSETRKLYDMAFKAASAPATVLLLGQSGTGKSVLARAIHDRSPQKENSFVTVACPSLSRELLESELFGHVKGSFTGAVGETWGKVALADGGTLFLDEIGELPLEIQPKLLRLLQEKEYERVGETKVRRANVRLIAATNRDLEQAVKDGRFREDLFYRLNVIALEMPSLHRRKADLLRLANGYLDFCVRQCGKSTSSFSPAVEAALLAYSWPGNLRELRNAVERAVILAEHEQIQLCDLPQQIAQTSGDSGVSSPSPGNPISLEDLESEHIRQVLRQTNTMEAAARILGIDTATLYRKRKKLGL